MLSDGVDQDSLKYLDAGLKTEPLQGLNILSDNIGDLQLLRFGKLLIFLKLVEPDS